MNYCLKAGILYAAGRDTPLASIRTVPGAQTRRIFTPEGGLAARTEVRPRPNLRGGEQGVETREYVLYDRQDKEWAVARPAYCPQDAPDVAGWPVCRTPRADCASLWLNGREGLLQMCGGGHYSLQTGERMLLRLTHRGVLGGWDLEAQDELSVVFVCGAFLFCRYLEKENEFLTV